MRLCPVCGADNDADARFCGVCGSQLPAAGRSIEARQPTREAVPPARPRPAGGPVRPPVADAAGRGVAATIEPSSVHVEPGGAAKAQVRIVNLSRVVDEYRIELLGEAATWTTVQPATISLFPGATGTVEIQVRPPRTMHARAGTFPVTIRVRSVADASKEVYGQAQIRVGAFEAVTVGLVPRTSSGSREATHELTIHNQGNSLIQLAITASDPDRKLQFVFPVPAIALEAGQRTTVPIRVRPARTFLRGNPVTLPFQVVVVPGGGTPITAEANFAQQAILPAWIGRAVAAVAALLVLGVVGVVVLPRLLAGPVTTTPGAPTAGIGAQVSASVPVLVPGTAPPGPVTAPPPEVTDPPEPPVSEEPAEVTPTPTATPTETIEPTTPPPTTPPPTTPPPLVPLACDGRPAETLTLRVGTGTGTYAIPENTLACISRVAFYPSPAAVDREPFNIVVSAGNQSYVVEAATVLDQPGVEPNPNPAEVPAGGGITWQADCTCDGYFALIQLVLHPGDGRGTIAISGSALLVEPFQQDMDLGGAGTADLVSDGSQLVAATGPLLALSLSPGGYAECWAKLPTAGTEPVPIAGLVDGTRLCLRTDLGSIVSGTVTGTPDNLLLEYTTYEP